MTFFPSSEAYVTKIRAPFIPLPKPNAAHDCPAGAEKWKNRESVLSEGTLRETVTLLLGSGDVPKPVYVEAGKAACAVKKKAARSSVSQMVLSARSG